jgi:hypothetical protein
MRVAVASPTVERTIRSAIDRPLRRDRARAVRAATRLMTDLAW